MKLLYGFLGALLGATLGGATAFLFVSSAVDGDGLGTVLLMMVWGPAGLIVGSTVGVLLALHVLHYVKGNRQGIYAKRNNALLVSVYVLAVPMLVAALIWNGNECQYPPSDQQLINNFGSHRAEFYELAQMKLTDEGLMQVGDDRTQPDDPQAVGVSPGRIAEYRRLLNRAGVRRGMQADGLHGMDFASWAQGGATSSDVDKGYAYLAVPPKQLLKNLDAYQPDGLHQIEVYRHIEGCWYLYYDYLPG